VPPLAWATLHSALHFGEQDCNVVFEQEASFLKLFEHLVSGRLIFGFNAPNMTIDLVISGCKPFELLIRFR